MPFYKDDSENNILPLPDIIDSTGLKADDRESIIELIMEMSGAQTIVEDAFKIFKSNQSDSLLEDVDQVTQGMDELFDKFKGMLTHHQRRELAQQKYTFMNDRQLDFIYGHGGMLNSTLHRHGVNDYKRMSNREKEKLLINDLRRLADDVPKSKHTRKKRSLTVLAPFSFGPGIVSPSFLGPTVLSPNLFSPAIISPFMLSPPTLSPSIGSPLVLSPYFLSPNVISAAIFEVYLLSPYFIAPNVVNPYLMSPIILSPHMLCPDVVSPTLLSGAVLNPYFLSPSIFTESALAADIMSPSFLSKKKRKK